MSKPRLKAARSHSRHRILLLEILTLPGLDIRGLDRTRRVNEAGSAISNGAQSAYQIILHVERQAFIVDVYPVTHCDAVVRFLGRGPGDIRLVQKLDPYT